MPYYAFPVIRLMIPLALAAGHGLLTTDSLAEDDPFAAGVRTTPWLSPADEQKSRDILNPSLGPEILLRYILIFFQITVASPFALPYIPRSVLPDGTLGFSLGNSLEPSRYGKIRDAAK